MAKGEGGKKTIERNKKAFFNYHIDERFEAGISLQGSEVKSIREGRVSLQESYAQFSDDGELFLVGAHVAEYPFANRNNHDPVRRRKLLLNRRELAKLDDKIKQDGYTIVPLSMYFRRGMVKVEIGLGKGKKIHDKRQDLKKKQAKREMDRAMREHR